SWSDQGQVEAGPGSFISVNPGEVHDGRPGGGRSRAWRLLYIDPQVMSESDADVREGCSRPFAFAAPVFADDALRALFDAAYARLIRMDDGRMAAETALLRLISRLAPHATVRSSTSDDRPAPSIRRARGRIDEAPAEPLTLAALAAEAGVSRYQLIRGFVRE